MRKQSFKSAGRILAFLLVLVLVLGCFHEIFKVKSGDGIYDLTKFYQLPDNSVDVLILGSSHAFENFNTGTLWDEYGMASFILAGSIQPMWNTYYYLKEALKTQTPELIVLEGFCVTFCQDYSDDSRIIKNTYGLRWSTDKIDSIKVSSPETRWPEFLLEYTQYHNRYREIDAGDFKKNQNNNLYVDWKGFGCNMGTSPLAFSNVTEVVGKAPMYEKTEKYYRKTLELAKESNIPTIVIVTPYARIDEEAQEAFNTASDIAGEYGIPFYNGNLHNDEIGLDFTTDVADADHLNYKGNQKFTSFIGSYLKERYEISDRRGDQAYESWQRSADYITQMINNQKLTECTDLESIEEYIADSDYTLFVGTSGYSTRDDENINTFFEKLNIQTDSNRGLWFLTSDGVIWESGEDEAEKFIRTDKHDFGLERIHDRNKHLYVNHIVVDNVNQEKVANGLNVVVYDDVTETIVLAFGINANDSYHLVRE